MIVLFDIIIFYIFIFTTSTIIISYGKSFSDFFNIKISCISLNIISGCFFLGSLSLIINFFLPLNIYVNNLVFLVGTFLVIRNLKYLKKGLSLILIISFIAFITGVYENINRPDAALYHLPFISNLNENKIILGLNNLHERFGLVSFFQYLSAIFYNSIFKDKVIFFPNLILYASALVYLFKLSINKNSINEIKILSLFFAISIVVDMNRFSEFGNDENAHMLYFILITQIVALYLGKANNKANTINIILLISLFLFMIKITYSIIIFLILLISISAFKYVKFYENFKIFLYFILSLWLFKSFLISGCFMYPIEFTCINKIPWAYNANIDLISESWAKGYPDSGQKLQMDYYIKEFNWLQTWLNHHFIFILKKILIILIIFILLIKFINEKEIEIYYGNKFKILIFINLFFCLFWFLKFPVYRFGSGFLIATIILCFTLFLKGFNSNRYEKILKMTLVLSVVLISYKGFNRTFDKISSENYKPWINIFSNDQNQIISYKKIYFNNSDEEFYYIPASGELCFYSPSPCSHILNENLFLVKKGTYKIISRRF